MPNRRTALLRTGVIVGVLILVFGIILPRFVDYSDVRAALAGLTLPQFALMTVLGVIVLLMIRPQGLIASKVRK